MTELREQLQRALGSSYALGAELAGGGMSRVFVAEESALGRRVVVKVLPPELTAEVNAERFRREIRLAASLQEPLIVPVLGTGESQGLLYYTMPFVEGETLQARIAREHELPHGDVVRILRDVLTALAYAHEHQVVHRDIKPANVLLTGPHAIVADFGVAKALGASMGDDKLTSSGIALGTPAYMAPEQAMGDPAVDHRADLYAVGVLAYEMLTGRPPFVAGSPQQLIGRIVTQSPAALKAERPSTPAALAQLVHRLLSKSPADRPQSAREVLRALDDRTMGSDLAGADVVPFSRLVRTRWRVRQGILAALVVLVAAATWYALSRRHTSRRDLPAAAPAADTIRRIAVLPLRNESQDPENAYFASALTDEMIGALMQLPGLRVTARTSVDALAGKNLGVQAIGDTLKVTGVIEGAVQRSGTRMRLTVRLVNARDNTSLWTDTFEREVIDAFAVEGEVARSVASALRLRLVTAGQPASESPLTRDADAMDLYLRGRTLVGAREDLERAVTYFKQAIARDSGFAEAHAGLGWVYLYLSAEGGRPDLIPHARAEVMHALRLRESSAEAHAALAALERDVDNDWDAAERHYKRAIGLNPSYAEARDGYAILLALRGRRDESYRQSAQARALDPLSAITLLHGCWIVFLGRQLDSAVACARDASAVAPKSGAFELYWLGFVLTARGSFDEALAAYGQADARSGSDTLDQSLRGYTLAMMGRRREAARIAARMAADMASGRFSPEPYDFARLYVALGDTVSAIEWLEKGANRVHPSRFSLGTDPTFDPIRSDPRFKAILTRLHLTR
jgi:eukaryotic-like serine/threonine-protein kinase